MDIITSATECSIPITMSSAGGLFLEDEPYRKCTINATRNEHHLSFKLCEIKTFINTDFPEILFSAESEEFIFSDLDNAFR